jgi:hypothetical protein
MKKIVLIAGVLVLSSISCSLGPKVMFTDDRALEEMTIPVEYVSGLPSVRSSTTGVLKITPATTRFVSDSGVTHLNLPTSMIRDVEVRSVAEMKLWRFLFMSVFAFFVKDKTEYLDLSCNDPQNESLIGMEFKIKVGTGPALRNAIISKRDMAVAAQAPGEKPAAAKPEYEMAFDRAMAADTISAWEGYIRTQANPEFRDKARFRLKELLEESDWKATVEADTAAKYEEFLARNPDSKHAEEARAGLARIRDGRQQEAGERPEVPKPADAAMKEEATPDQKLPGAILVGKIDEVSSLIKAGADVNREFNLGATGDVPPIFLACTISPEDPAAAAAIVRALLGAGADSQYKYRGTTNLLFLAVQYGGNPSIIDPLVENGLDINAGNHLGQTPLHAAAFHGKTEWIEPLMKRGATLDPRDSSGQTPLHHGVIQKKAEAVAVLLSKGADVNAKTNSGLTPFDLASETDIKNLIVKRGGISGKK